MENQIVAGLAIQDVSVDQALLKEEVIRVDKDVYLAGDLSDGKLEEHVKNEHIQTVMNLRNKDEPGYKGVAIHANVKYLNFPTEPETKPSAEILQLIAVEVKKAAKPVLIKCHRGFRSKFVAEYLFSNRATDLFSNRIEQVTPELFVAGQVNEEDVKLAHAHKIKAVVNLRMPQELSPAEIAQERQWCVEAGLEFYHFPVGGPGFLQDAEKMDTVVAELSKVPRPALIHCKSGMRAKIATLMTLHTGVAKEVAPPIPDTIVDMVSNYVNQRGHSIRLNEHLLKVSDEVYITGQLDAEQMKELPKFVKSVLNLRDPAEEGFLKGEQQILEALGLKYLNVPTQVEKIPTAEDFAKIHAALAELPKPALIHCRKGFRSSHFVNKIE